MKVPHTKRALRFVNLTAAIVVTVGILYLAFFGAGPLPALGPAFNPLTGAWTMAADAQVHSETLDIAGLRQPVTVIFERDGTAHIVAQTDDDLFVAIGYVQARFRLFQMDLLRRQGEGRLSEVVGKAALDSDRFELQLGLLRTAQQEWDNGLGGFGLTRRESAALVDFSRGVNDRIAEAESNHTLDVMFTLLGYQPRPWTPVDSLVVKGDMTQTLNFTDTPLVMALLNKSLGTDLTTEWFPIQAPNAQSPYDPGPYPRSAPVTPICIGGALCPTAAVSDGEAAAASDVLQRLAALPPGLVATGGDSNNWAVAGSRSASGGALMAGDPHLHLTLPSIWFQMTMDSPGYHASGVSIPGTPVVLIGHNQHVSWSLTDAQNQQTFYYLEHEDKSHPGQYEWQGSWRAYDSVGYDIPVKGGATQHLTVKLSVHGPVITQRGQTTSVWWAGNLPSQDLEVLLGLDQASDWQQFRDALRGWYSPTHNFVYADDKGNIGMISAGYYPQVPAQARPWLPMPGTGEADVTGTIPYDLIPQVYDPPSGIVWSANQRQVTDSYPYYIGTTSNFFDPGYRADEIHRVLTPPAPACPALNASTCGPKFTAGDMMALQTDTRDYLASQIVPVLIQSLSVEQLSPREATALDLLKGWDYHMDVSSAAATLWWTFWQSYLSETFDPWWKSRHVPVSRTESGASTATTQLDDALSQDLEAWTLGDPVNRAFSAPGAGERNAMDVMRKAFHTTVANLGKQLGSDPRSWTWGRVHQRELENLAQISGLSYGPAPDRGDAFTPLAAPDFPSTHGPSWRMVVDWGTGTFSGVYPGGQSENPASAWYTDRVQTWWDGLYSPMLTAGEAATAGGTVTWTLR